MLHPLFLRPPAAHCPIPLRHTLRAATSTLLGLTLLITPPLVRAVEANPVISIGTGGATGIYYATGGAICHLINKERERFRKRCAVETTNASVSNIMGLKDGRLTLGLVQSDVQYDARKGLGPFRKAGPDGKLRAVLSLYPEPLTLVARQGIEAHGIKDFRKHPFSIGNPGSGTRSAMDTLMAAYRLKSSHFSKVFELKADEHGAALCDGRIDGFVFVAGHPSANLQDVTTTCAARLVPLQGPVIDRLVEEKPYYAKVEIPANTYPGNPDPTPTFGALATLVSSSDVPDDTVYAVVKSIFEHFDEFRKLHPALAHLEPEQMVHQGLTMPLHAGALRYYRERGWIQ